MTGLDHYIIVESAAAWRHVEGLAENARRATWATTSPYVLESLLMAGRTAVGLDEAVSQEEADRIGYLSLTTSHRLAQHVDNARSGWPFGLRPGHALHATLHRLLTPLLYKALLLDRLARRMQDKDRITVVGTTDLTPVSGFEVMIDRFDTVFSVLGREMGHNFVEFHAPRPSGALENGDFLRPTWWTRAVTVLNAPISAPAFRLWSLCSKRRPFRLVPGRGGQRVLIHKPNELIEEIFTHLALGGATLQGAPPLEVPRSAPEAMQADLLSDLPACLERFCRDETSARGFEWNSAFASATRLAAQRVQDALAYFGPTSQRVAEYCNRLRGNAEAGSLRMVTNALTTPIERLVKQGLASAGIPVYTVEHGVSVGLSPLHLAEYRNGLMPEMKSTIYFNRCQQLAEASGRNVPADRWAVVGAPRMIRNLGLRRLQRLAVRRRYAVRNRLIVWVTGLYPNNHQRLPHYWRDIPYHRIRKRLVYDVFARCQDTVLLKLYPTYRYADGDPFATLLPMPPNCRLDQFVDLRNMRAAADLFVIDAPGSGLGWTWATGVPQIYVETGMYSLLPEIASDFERALFYVDATSAGWDETLRALLDIPHTDLLAQYAARAEARRRLNEYCILGPDGVPGRRAAEFILTNTTDAIVAREGEPLRQQGSRL